jgi:hypothetical protein
MYQGVYGKAADTLLAVAGEIDFVTFLMADNIDLIRHFGVARDRYIHMYVYIYIYECVCICIYVNDLFDA